VTPIFFTDRDLGKQFPEILRAAGLKVERHVDHFPHDCPDEVWLREIGRRRWIRYKPNELAAVTQHRVPLMVVVGQTPFPQLAHSFVVTFPRVQRFIEEHTPPYIAKVYRASASDAAADPSAGGRVELWYPTQRIR
jgi:hypothetical protein